MGSARSVNALAIVATHAKDLAAQDKVALDEAKRREEKLRRAPAGPSHGAPSGTSKWNGRCDADSKRKVGVEGCGKLEL